MDKEALTGAMRISSEENNEVREKFLTGKDRIVDGTRLKALSIVSQYAKQLIKNMMDLKTSNGKHLVKNGVSNSTKTLGLIENLIASEYTCLVNTVDWCNSVGKVNEIVGYSSMEELNKELMEKMRLSKMQKNIFAKKGLGITLLRVIACDIRLWHIWDLVYMHSRGRDVRSPCYKKVKNNSFCVYWTINTF